MARPPAANTFLQRLIGAAALDTAIYEEVEADSAATGQALLVVILFSIAAAVGAAGLGGHIQVRVVYIGIMALLAWAAWALLTFEIGARVMPESKTHSDPGELMRTLGFSATPGVLLVFAVLPAVAVPVFIVVSVWMLLSMVVAIRQALDYSSTIRAVVVCVFGWVLATTLAIVIGLAFAPTVS